MAADDSSRSPTTELITRCTRTRRRRKNPTEPRLSQIMAQGVFFCQRDITQGRAKTLGSDRSDGWRHGFQASCNGLRDVWVERGVRNAVVLSGDVHIPFVNEIKANFDDRDSATVGVQFSRRPSRRPGDGTDNPDKSVMIENPYVKYRADRRGYLSLRVDQQQLRAGFAAMPYISKPGAPISIAKSFVVPAGDRELNDVTASKLS